MAVTCARCGAQNPDGNSFCQACGTPLTAAALHGMTAPGPPPSPPAPYAPAPPQSPYYSPAPNAIQPPIHRTPLMLIVSAVVALILVMAGAGTAIALIAERSHNQTASGIDTQLPTPSPATTPTPIGSPTPVETGSTVSNDGLVMPLPSGWTVENKDTESITLGDPNGEGTFTAASGASSPAMTVQQNKEEIDKYFTANYRGAAPCPGTATTSGTLNGAAGVFWTMCFTITQSGQSFPAAAALFAGANSNGSVYYVVMIVSTKDNLQAVEAESRSLLAGIQWKLR